MTFLEKPPIERVPHVYTLDQVRYSARLRDMMPRIDLDTITFASGSSDIDQQQARPSRPSPTRSRPSFAGIRARYS